MTKRSWLSLIQYLHHHVVKIMDGSLFIVKMELSQYNTIGFTPFGLYTWARTAEATINRLNTHDSNTTDVVSEGSQNASCTQTTTISVIASTPTKIDMLSSNSAFQEIAFSFVGAGQGADRIF